MRTTYVARGKQTSRNPFSFKGIKVTHVAGVGWTKKGRARATARLTTAQSHAIKTATQHNLQNSYRGVLGKGRVKQFRADNRQLHAAGLRRAGGLNRYTTTRQHHRRTSYNRGYHGRFA